MNLQQMADKIMTLDWRLTSMPAREKKWATAEIVKLLREAYDMGRADEKRAHDTVMAIESGGELVTFQPEEKP